MKIRRHPFFYTSILLIILTLVASYARFIVLNDYLVSYEADCDPFTHDCFIGCNDDSCDDVYYFALIEKYAPSLESQCGIDITGCENAQVCTEQDGASCEITYCRSSENEDCDSLSEVDIPFSTL